MKIIFLVISLQHFSAMAASENFCPDPKAFCIQDFENLTQKQTSLEDVIKQLPASVQQNVTFKRGNNIPKTIHGKKTILGPHGHIAPTAESQSATPQEPRAIVWDQTSGFSASWNSGNPNQSAFDRVDLYSFDFNSKKHRLSSWTAKEGFADQYHADQNGRRCVTCHGEVQRPILPMYPDWPQFYGEFNDEMNGYNDKEQAIRSDLKQMANEFQPVERKYYFDFLNNEAKTNPRYSSLFQAEPSLSFINKYYPYRPRNTTSPTSDVSRAFYFRPNLRLGVMYNRLVALATFERIKQTKVFRKFPDIIFYSLLDCNWETSQKSGTAERIQILNTFLKEVSSMEAQWADMDLRGTVFSAADLDMYTPAQIKKNGFLEQKNTNELFYKKHIPYQTKGYRQIPYEDILKLLQLNIADMDIRFRYDVSNKVAKKFNIYDARAYYFTQSAMDIGYIEDTYFLNPICDNANKKCNFSYAGTTMQNMKYFNSYFDGSATTNELLAAQMLLFLTSAGTEVEFSKDVLEVRQLLKNKIPQASYYFESLSKKYSGFEDRLTYDKDFFKKMDELSPWIQLPYPPDLLNIHNRESFWGNSEKTKEIRLKHVQWLSVKDQMNDVANLNGGQNICWNVYDVLKKRYLK